MALPDTNISVAMVRDELGASTNDVGRLCIHPNINKWSRNKPIASNSLVEVTDEDRYRLHFGFEIPTNSSGVWVYERPRGGTEQEYFRLLDFCNYEHKKYQEFTYYNNIDTDMQTPVEVYLPKYIYVDNDSIIKVKFISPISNNGLITLQDLFGDKGRLALQIKDIATGSVYVDLSDWFINMPGYDYTPFPQVMFTVNGESSYIIRDDNMIEVSVYAVDESLGQHDVEYIKNNLEGGSVFYSLKADDNVEPSKEYRVVDASSAFAVIFNLNYLHQEGAALYFSDIMGNELTLDARSTAQERYYGGTLRNAEMTIASDIFTVQDEYSFPIMDIDVPIDSVVQAQFDPSGLGVAMTLPADYANKTANFNWVIRGEVIGVMKVLKEGTYTKTL